MKFSLIFIGLLLVARVRIRYPIVPALYWACLDSDSFGKLEFSNERVCNSQCQADCQRIRVSKKRYVFVCGSKLRDGQ